MDARERSFLEEAQRYHASGGDLDALVVVYINSDSVPRCHDCPRGYTRLFYASLQGWCAVINWLLEQGADVHEEQGSEGLTPLHTAAYKDQRDAAVLLLDAGARVDDRSGPGETALHRAAYRGHTSMCKLFLSRGASLDVRNNAAKDPEAHARRLGNTATAAFLAEVRAAGGWDKFVHEPRAELLALRQQLPSLRERGRASPSTVRAHERLFLNTSLPDEVFSQILAFWRTSRDY